LNKINPDAYAGLTLILLFFPEETSTHALAKHRNTRYFRKPAKQATQNSTVLLTHLYQIGHISVKEISPKSQKISGQRQQIV
jgi:hypothetical protein